jgi:hypothetical protein
MEFTNQYRSTPVNNDQPSWLAAVTGPDITPEVTKQPEAVPRPIQDISSVAEMGAAGLLPLSNVSSAGSNNSVVPTAPIHPAYETLPCLTRFNFFLSTTFGETCRTRCACVGLIFSWVPPVGCITWLFNYDAACCKKRCLLADASCVLSTLATVLLILLLIRFL